MAEHLLRDAHHIPMLNYGATCALLLCAAATVRGVPADSPCAGTARPCAGTRRPGAGRVVRVIGTPAGTGRVVPIGTRDEDADERPGHRDADADAGTIWPSCQPDRSDLGLLRVRELKAWPPPQPARRRRRRRRRHRAAAAVTAPAAAATDAPRRPPARAHGRRRLLPPPRLLVRRRQRQPVSSTISQRNRRRVCCCAHTYNTFTQGAHPLPPRLRAERRLLPRPYRLGAQSDQIRRRIHLCRRAV